MFLDYLGLYCALQVYGNTSLQNEVIRGGAFSVPQN
jgi:hypothetical protein